MSKKNLMKKAGVLALTALVLQGAPAAILNPVNVIAADYSYTPLELFSALADNEALPYTLSDNAATFLDEHPEYFPAASVYDILDEDADLELDYKHFSKNPSKYGDKLMVLAQAYVVQIQEEEISDGEYLTWLNLIDDDSKYYSVYYNGSLDDVFEDDTVGVVGLPLDTSSFENTDGGDTLVIVLAGSLVVPADSTDYNY